MYGDRGRAGVGVSVEVRVGVGLVSSCTYDSALFI